MSVPLSTKWLWVRVQLLSLNLWNRIVKTKHSLALFTLLPRDLMTFLCYFLYSSMSVKSVEYEYVVESPFFQKKNVETENRSVSPSNMNQVYESCWRTQWWWGLPPNSISKNRFQISSSHAKHNWRLSEGMLSYVIQQFHTFYSTGVSKYNPIPSKFLPLAHLDDFLKGVLE